MRRLVELHGGSVEARSEGRERGAEFLIRLPVVQKAAARDPKAEEDVPSEAPAPSRRVLVVDDNVDSAATMAALLSLQGHDVRVAYDGVKALEEAVGFRPDVAILDIGMPKMNGYTLATRIREHMGDAQPLLIAVTGWGQAEDRHRSQAAGFDHHLVKPVDPAALCAMLASRPAERTLH